MPISDDATYQSAWNEAMRRVVVRDTALLAYVAAAGTLLATSLQKQNGRPELAIAIPFITFIVGCIIAHHDFMIGRLNRYLQDFRPVNQKQKLWHSAHLGPPVIAGLLLYTLPAVLIFGGYSLVAIRIARTVVPPLAPLVVMAARFAAWTGLIALLFGRGSQLFTLNYGELFGRGQHQRNELEKQTKDPPLTNSQETS